MPSNTLRRGARFGARVTVNGRQVWLGTFDTEELAQAAADAARMGGGRVGSVGDWWEAWPALAGARRARSPETIAHTLALSAGFVRSFGALKLASLSRGMVLRWAQANPGVARYARTILSDAVWAGALAANPLDGVRFAPRSEACARLSASDVLALSGACDGVAMRVLVLTCAYSGLRLSEALALEARDLEGDLLHVRCGKGGKEGWSVLFEPGRAGFRGFAPDVGRVFPSWDRRTVNRRWIAARDACGIDARFHDLRHFHASWLIDRGVQRADVAQQLRHSGLRDVDRYLHPSAAPALERVRGAASPAAALGDRQEVCP